MNKITENKYVDFMNELFQEYYLNAEKRKFLETHKIRKTLLKRYREMVAELETTDLDYNGLRHFAKFIFYLEKTFCYSNDFTKDNLTVVSPTTGTDKQEMLYVSQPNKDVLKSTYSAKFEIYFDYNSGEETVKIEINRNTNRNIKNVFVVHSGATNYTTDFDIETVTILNMIMRNATSSLFRKYGDKIIDHIVLYPIMRDAFYEESLGDY